MKTTTLKQPTNISTLIHASTQARPVNHKLLRKVNTTSQSVKNELISGSDQLHEDSHEIIEHRRGHDFSKIGSRTHELHATAESQLRSTRRLPSAQYPLLFQPKLTVNIPGDQYEQEADRIAEQVMRMPDPQVQRQCSCGGSTKSGECPECKKKKKEESIKLQRASTSSIGGMSAPPIVNEILSSSGAPLPTTTRSFMESRFGQDFSHVRVHTNERAAESAEAVQAKAYTVGNNIVFGRGKKSFQRPTPTCSRTYSCHSATRNATF